MPLAKELVAAGFSPIQATASSNGMTAAIVAAGTTQATGTAVNAGFNRVTAADGTKGVTLPAGSPGDSMIIVNDSGSTLKVYPPSGAALGVPGTSFGAAVADASYAHTTFAVVEYTCYSSLFWVVNKSA